MILLILCISNCQAKQELAF